MLGSFEFIRQEFSELRPPSKSVKHTPFYSPLLPYVGSIPALWVKTQRYFVLEFVDATLRGVAQVVYCNNPLSGLLIFIGLLLQSRWFALMGIIACASGTAMAYLMRLEAGPSYINSHCHPNKTYSWMPTGSQTATHAGVNGYNAILVGLGLATFFPEWNWNLLLPVILLGAASTLIQSVYRRLLWRLGSPAFTFAFNTCFLLFCLAGSISPTFHFLRSAGTFAVPRLDKRPGATVSAKAILQAVGQVYLVDDLWGSAFILIGHVVCSPALALTSVMGSCIALGTAHWFAFFNPIPTGLVGYNGILCMQAVGGFFLAPNTTSLLLASFAACLSTLLQAALIATFGVWAIPIGTLPFCITSLVFIQLQHSVSTAIAVPLVALDTPEAHFIGMREVQSSLRHWEDLLDVDSKKGWIAKSTVLRDLHERWRADSFFGKERTPFFTFVKRLESWLISYYGAPNVSHVLEGLTATLNVYHWEDEHAISSREVVTATLTGLEWPQAVRLFELFDLDCDGCVALNDMAAVYCKFGMDFKNVASKWNTIVSSETAFNLKDFLLLYYTLQRFKTGTLSELKPTAAIANPLRPVIIPETSMQLEEV